MEKSILLIRSVIPQGKSVPLRWKMRFAKLYNLFFRFLSRDEMNCPLYQDFTRTCIKKFPEFIEFPTYSFCKSDDYKKCLAYIIYSSPFVCKYLVPCGNAYKKDVPIIITNMFGETETREIYYHLTVHYCLSQENHINCAKYKIYEQKKKPPLNLLPDGRRVHFIDALLKRKIIEEEPQ